MPPITTKKIVFENNREATAIFPSADSSAEEIAAALGVNQPQAVLLIIGGADKLDEKVSASRLIQLFGRGVARAALEMNALIIDGGTESGIMKMMGQGVADRGFKSTLIGVAPTGEIKYPGSEDGGTTPLDPNHSHFVLVEAKKFGDETGMLFMLVDWFKSNAKAPAVVLLAAGGDVSRREALQAVRQNLPLIVFEGSGGVADEIVTAWKKKSDLPDDPVMAEIIADGRIELHSLDNPVKGAERLILRQLGGDNVLLQAWERFSVYDLNAVLLQKKFYRLQLMILWLGLLATGLALLKERYDRPPTVPPFVTATPSPSPGATATPTPVSATTTPASATITPGATVTPSPANTVQLSVSWGYVYYIPLIIAIILAILITAAIRLKRMSVGWGYIYYILLIIATVLTILIIAAIRFKRMSVVWGYAYYILLIIPIVLTILITAANRFKQGNKWLLLRGGAEAIKREIYKYRARATDGYNGVVKTPPPAPGDPPPPTPEQVLAQKVEDVTRRVMQTEVNTSSLLPYTGGLPPNMDYAQGGDDGTSILSPDRYVQVRLGDQLDYYRGKTVKLERTLKRIQWSIYIIGGLGTFLAAINQQVWIALTTALAAALATFLAYKQTENTLTKYNQASTDLDSVKRWWTALPAEQQVKQENIDALVEHTEKILQSELDGWVQQMQNALEELRQAQEKAVKKQEPPTDEEKVAAAKAAADKAAKKEEPPTDEEKAAAAKATADKAAKKEGPPTDEEKAAAAKAAADKAAKKEEPPTDEEKAAAAKAAADKAAKKEGPPTDEEKAAAAKAAADKAAADEAAKQPAGENAGDDKAGDVKPPGGNP